MKYPKELYTGSGFHDDGDYYIENYKERVVKCRKSHKCVSCKKEIKQGEDALLETGFMYGKPVTAYTCLLCIEKWLEESGQAEENMRAEPEEIKNEN